MGGWYGLLMWYGMGFYRVFQGINVLLFFCGTMFLPLVYPIVLAHVVVV